MLLGKSSKKISLQCCTAFITENLPISGPPQFQPEFEGQPYHAQLTGFLIFNSVNYTSYRIKKILLLN